VVCLSVFMPIRNIQWSQLKIGSVVGIFITDKYVQKNLSKIQ